MNIRKKRLSFLENRQVLPVGKEVGRGAHQIVEGDQKVQTFDYKINYGDESAE